jgi:hypothetical protein
MQFQCFHLSFQEPLALLDIDRDADLKLSPPLTFSLFVWKNKKNLFG